MKRRSFLGTGLGAGALAAGCVWRAYRQGLLEWSGGPAELAQADPPAPDAEVARRIDLLRAAGLAASPWNSQPWLFRIDQRRIEVWNDPSRNGGDCDPFLRQLHLGVGCAVENLVQISVARDRSAHVNLATGRLPGRSETITSTPVARINLVPSSGTFSSLAAAIPERRTHRGAFIPERRVAADLLVDLAQVAANEPGVTMFLYTAAGDVAEFRRIVLASAGSNLADPAMLTGVDRWIRHERAEQATGDGLPWEVSGMKPAAVAAIKFMPRLAPHISARLAYERLRDIQLPSTRVFGMIAVRDPESMAFAVGAGRIWQRAHLWLTAGGLSAQALAYPVERADRDRQLDRPSPLGRDFAALTGGDQWTPALGFRLGYAADTPAASPRRRLFDTLLPAA